MKKEARKGKAMNLEPLSIFGALHFGHLNNVKFLSM